MFVAGPASDTSTAWLRGDREPADVHRDRLREPEHPERGERQQQREDDRPERVDVRDGVQREAPRPLRGVVTAPVRDEAVGDLVEDDRGNQDPEEDQG